MRMSSLFAPTLREAPGDAEAASHRLLVRAGFIRPLASGIYGFLPLGLRTLSRVASVVRAEMDRAGALEIQLPALLPAEPWQATGRWDAYGDLMFRLRDRSGRQLCLGPTHEEALTPLVGAARVSHRDLPLNLYQIQWKYRDEPRPRSGLVRAREFLMKDAYSFDRDVDGLRASYEQMIGAYARTFDRCAVETRMVEADPGLIGGDVNHEFMAPAAVGEDRFVACSSCSYAANLEAARASVPEASEAPLEPLTEIHTPGRPGIKAVVELLGIRPQDMLKAMVYEVGGRVHVILVPGDREVNEPKLRRALAGADVRRVEEHDFDRVGMVKGYVGPQGLRDATVVADVRVRAGRNWVTGANRLDHHVTGANLNTDFAVDVWAEIATVEGGDECPTCRGSLVLNRAIELGHCFQLGTRYSEPLGATFTDEDSSSRPLVMGCYGIGVSRIVAAVAEQRHDDAGLRWPRVVAPSDAVVLPLNMDSPAVVSESEALYSELTSRDVGVVHDDRQASAGVKFADADLIGWPVQVIVGRRGVEEGVIEVKERATGERRRVPRGEAVDLVLERLASA